MTDPSSGPRWLWHGVYAAVIALLCASVYFAAKSVDYTWRWDRVPAYILAYESTDLITPYTGIASVPGDGSVARGVVLWKMSTIKPPPFLRDLPASPQRPKPMAFLWK